MIDQHNSLIEKFLKKGIRLYVFGFIISPIGYIVKIIISNQLSIDEVGILYGIISLITLLTAFNDFGITESLNYFIPQYINEKRYDKVKSILIFSLGIQLFTSILLMLVFFFGADFIGNHYFKSDIAINSIKIFSLFFLGINIFNVINVFFQSIQNTFLNRLTECFRMVSILIFVLFIFLGNHSSLENYSYGWVIGVYSGLFLSAILFFNKYYLSYFKGEKIFIDKVFFKGILKYAFISMLGYQAGTILSQIDMQMIIYILGNKDAGYYTNYLSIMAAPYVFIGPIFGFLFPVLSELNSKKDYVKIGIIRKEISKIMITFGTMLSIFIFTLATGIAFALFGEKFIESGVILRYSILFLVINLLINVNFNIFAGLGEPKERLKIISQAIFINIILNYFLIKTMGVYGASLATAIGWIFIYIKSEIKLKKQFPINNINLLEIIKNIIVFGILSPITYYIYLYFGELSRGKSLFLILIFGFLWFFIYIFINKKDFVVILNEVKLIKNKEKKKNDKNINNLN